MSLDSARLYLDTSECISATDIFRESCSTDFIFDQHCAFLELLFAKNWSRYLYAVWIICFSVGCFREVSSGAIIMRFPIAETFVPSPVVTENPRRSNDDTEGVRGRRGVLILVLAVAVLCVVLR